VTEPDASLQRSAGLPAGKYKGNSEQQQQQQLAQPRLGPRVHCHVAAQCWAPLQIALQLAAFISKNCRKHTVL
jgi:hypothetical protein